MRNPLQPTLSSQNTSTSLSGTVKGRERLFNNAHFSQGSCPNTLEWVRTISSDIADPDLEDSTCDDGGEMDAGYLWHGTCHREKRPCPAPSACQAVLASTLLLLQAHILTGQGGPSCTPWPEENKAWLHSKMATVWQSAVNQYRARFGDRDGYVDKSPDKWEAREVSSS